MPWKTNQLSNYKTATKTNTITSRKCRFKNQQMTLREIYDQTLNIFESALVCKIKKSCVQHRAAGANKGIVYLHIHVYIHIHVHIHMCLLCFHLIYTMPALSRYLIINVSSPSMSFYLPPTLCRLGGCWAAI